jgi:hypothetical protein
MLTSGGWISLRGAYTACASEGVAHKLTFDLWCKFYFILKQRGQRVPCLKREKRTHLAQSRATKNPYKYLV